MKPLVPIAILALLPLLLFYAIVFDNDPENKDCARSRACTNQKVAEYFNGKKESTR